jgi:hypothetical protein
MLHPIMKYSLPRRPRCERLETRQLLAGDVCLVPPAEAAFAADELRVADQMAAEGEQNPALPSGLARRPTADEVASLMAELITSARDAVERELLMERQGVVAAFRAERPQPSDSGAAAEATGGVIYLMHRGVGDELLERAAIAVDFAPRRLLLSERSLLVVGDSSERSDPSSIETVWMSVDLDVPSRRQTGSLAGVLSGVAVEGDRMFVSALRIPEVMPAIYPPPPLPHTVAVFDVADGAAREIARGETFAAVTADALFGDDIVLLERRFAEAGADVIDWMQRRHELTRYRIAETQLVRVGSAELGGGDDVRSRLAADGQTAVVVARHPQLSGAQRESALQSTFRVDLVDLSGEIPVLFQSIDVATRSVQGSIEIGERAVVIADGLRRLWVVDVNQQIDVDPASRVSLVEYALQGGLGALSPLAIHEVAADRFLVTHPKRSIGETSDTSSASTMQLALLSAETLAVRSVLETRAGSVAVFTDGSATPKQIRLRGSYALPPLAAELQVIRVGDDGSLSAGSSVSLEGVLESDVNADRLLLRQRDRLVEYRWDALDVPIEMPLGEALPSPVAVDDVFRRNADGRNVYLDVLANDQFVESIPWGTAIARDSEPGRSDRLRIVDLVAAPEGVSIFHDRQIRIDEALLRSGESFRFQYTISQFGQESTAEVRVDLYRFSDDDVDDALNNVLQEVSEAASVPVEDVVAGRPIRYTARPMPGKLGIDVENPLGGAYGVVVDVIAAGQLFRYAADFEGNVARLTERPLETVMALNLHAVDGNGQPVETLRVGDEFFIEVIAEDLRAFGAGVFGVAFDLAIPPQYLELTGVVGLQGDFDQLGDAVGESGIDDFIALENIILHPGSAAQPVVRFGVRAVAGGEVALQLAPADRLGAELLLRGRDSEVSPLETRFGGLDLFIDGIRPTDTDGNGRVTPLDALRVINFLGRHGVVEVDRLPQLLTGEPESFDSQSDARLTAMQRLDINADRWITPRDALLVINEVARIAARPTVLGTAEGESLGDESFHDETLLPGEPRLF